MQSEIDLKKMLWHSRRGMLELDLLLKPFAEIHLKNLNKTDRQKYKALLQEEDQDLYRWLIGKGQPDDQNLIDIITIIKASQS